MSQNAGIIGKIIILGGSALAMIGRCASKSDDIFRVGARGFDDVAVVSDDAFRYGDDILKNTNDGLGSTSRSILDETVRPFGDIFSDIAIEGADWLLDEDEVEIEVPKENLLSDFRLDNIQSIRLGLSQNKHIFNEETKTNFLKILSYSTPIKNPKDPFGKLMLLKGTQTYSMLLGKDWIAIKTFQQKNYKYYSLIVDFTKTLEK